MTTITLEQLLRQNDQWRKPSPPFSYYVAHISRHPLYRKDIREYTPDDIRELLGCTRTYPWARKIYDLIKIHLAPHQRSTAEKVLHEMSEVWRGVSRRGAEVQKKKNALRRLDSGIEQYLQRRKLNSKQAQLYRRCYEVLRKNLTSEGDVDWNGVRRDTENIRKTPGSRYQMWSVVRRIAADLGIGKTIPSLFNKTAPREPDHAASEPYAHPANNPQITDLRSSFAEAIQSPTAFRCLISLGKTHPDWVAENIDLLENLLQQLYKEDTTDETC